MSLAPSTQPLVGEQRRSSIGKIMDKARAKMSGSERLPNDERDFEKEQRKAIERQKNKEAYERLRLGERTIYGMPGAGRINL